MNERKLKERSYTRCYWVVKILRIKERSVKMKGKPLLWYVVMKKVIEEYLIILISSPFKHC
jgi:hypothetical protein